ncbi:ABC transporter substrate-binding protein, partial [Escherichia coli]
RTLLSGKGARSEYISWDAILQVDPDVLLIAPCGFTIDQTRRELHALTDREGWADLRAVRTGKVSLLDGNAYFNRPGSRIYRAIE